MGLIAPDRVCEIIPGMTKRKLAQLRYLGTGPDYFRPTPKTVAYDEEHVMQWLKTTQVSAEAN